MVAAIWTLRGALALASVVPTVTTEAGEPPGAPEAGPAEEVGDGRPETARRAPRAPRAPRSPRSDARTGERTPRPAWPGTTGLFGFVQVDFLVRQISEDELSDGDRTPLNETGFLLRNARLGLRHDWKYFGVLASVELFNAGGPVRPAAFDVHAHWPRKDGGLPWVRLQVGLLRVPFGFEIYEERDPQRLFGERALVSRAFVPGLFDVGAALSGHLWAIDWVIGVYNGQPVGAPGFGFRDPNAAKDFAGRLRISGPLVSWLHGALGVSFLAGTGFAPGTPPTKDTFDWVDLNEDGRVTVAELLPVPGATGRSSENFRRWGVGADAQLTCSVPKLGPMTFSGEFMLGQDLDRAVVIANPVALGREQRGWGWMAAWRMALTRRAELGLRYDEYRPEQDGLEPYDGRTVVTRHHFRTLSSALAGHLYAGDRVRARLLVEVEHQWNTLGRDDRGRPARLDNDTVRVRTEVAF